MDMGMLVQQLIEEGDFQDLINNPAAQFGPAAQQHLGALILPERPVTANAFTEQGIRYRSIIANDGTRYSPVQKKKGILTGSVEVRLGHSDIGSEFTSRDYDALSAVLARAGQGRPPMSAVQRLLNWVRVTVSDPLRQKNEKMRWEAIVDASVPRQGDNGYVETVTLSNPTGHRVAAAAAWSNDANDPWDDIMDMAEFMKGKGYEISMMIAGRPVISKLAMNAKVRSRAGILSIASGSVVGLAGRADLATINARLQADGLPGITEYNRQYRTSTSTGYYLKRDVLVFVASTGQDEVVDLGDNEDLVLNDTLGYTAVGVPAGYDTPGRALVVESFRNKPPRVEAEGWQASFPVIVEPEGIGVIHTIT